MFLTKKKLAAIVAASFLVGGGLTVTAATWLAGFAPQNVSELVRFLGVRRFIESRYVGAVDEEKLMDGAIAGMVQSLDDPHSLYLDQELYGELTEQTEGSFGGIGVYMGFKDSKVTIISVMEGTPGEAAGLRAGDEIVAVDGTSVSEIQPEEVALRIRGEAGTKVTLTIRRAGEDDKDYEIERGTIKVRTARGKMLEDGMGYLRISNFAENTGEEFAEELSSLEEQGMKGMILDLRENPGGLVKSCVEVAKKIVPKGTIVSVVDKDGEKQEYDSDLEETKYSIVVLIDGNSASAAEILAGALQDTGAATLVGTTSYGKGSVQVILPLYHEDGLKLTIAKYYTPSGRSIDGTGITPDVESELPQDATEDTQLEKAEEILREKLAG